MSRYNQYLVLNLLALNLIMMNNLLVPQYNWVDMLAEAVALMNSGESRKLYKAFMLLNVALGLPDDGTKECLAAKMQVAVQLAHLYTVGIDAAGCEEGEEFDPRWEVEPDVEKARELLLLARKYGSTECEGMLAESCRAEEKERQTGVEHN